VINLSKVTALAVAMVIVFQLPAVADVVVEPSDRNSHVRLRGYDVVDRTTARPSGPNRNVSGPPAEFEPPRFEQCRVDPVIGLYGCRTDTPDPAEPADGPELTPGDVLRALREIGLPSLQVQVQPGNETLVNVQTILFADPQPFERSVELLDFDVDLVAEPVTYQWFPGDGSSFTTDEPGRPYPAMDVTHRYTAAADDVQARVDVTYQVRFRVDGGPWQPLAETLVATGPAAVLDVKDAAPVLTKP
jgi:hypothetical protein